MNPAPSADTRRRWVEAWNTTMVEIWQERIYKLGVVDSGALWRSPLSLPVRADGRFYDLTLSHTFLEYGLWQDLGVGREVPRGNGGDLGRDKARQRRRWFSARYYASVMRLRDFMARSLGDEFRGMVCDALDTGRLRARTRR